MSTAPTTPGRRIGDVINARQTTAAVLDYYSSATATAPHATTNLSDLIDDIRSDEFAERVATIRSAIASGDQARADALKKQLPAVSLSGSVDGRRARAAAEGRFRHSGFLQIDLDGKDNIGWTVEAMREILAADPRIAAVFVTASGAGVKGVARIPADAATHKAAFLAAEAHFRTLNLKIDPSCKDPVRLCFVSHDPKAWLREGPAECFAPAIAEAPAMIPARPAAAGSIKMRETGGMRDLTLADLADMLALIPRPPHEQWVKLCGGAWNHFGPDATPVLMKVWPEEVPGEYDYKFQHRLADVTIGSVIHAAQLAGYCPPIRARVLSLNVPVDQAVQIDEAVKSGSFLAALGQEHRGLAQAYANVRFGIRCYSHDECAWRYYENGIWKRDNTGTTLDDLQAALTPLLVESANGAIRKLDPVKDGAKIDHLRKRALCLYNLRTARAVLENAQVLPEFRAMRGDFDTNPHLLALENCVYDFTRGDAIPHSPDHMLTARAPITLDVEAECPEFDKFLSDVTCGDDELAEFHLQSVAIGLTGISSFDHVWFHFGDGSNGKSTFTQTVAGLAGPALFRSLDSGLLVGNRESSSDDYKRGSLEGVRLALCDELPDGKKLRVEELKKLCGGDDINARNPYEKPRSFHPTHSTWLAGNHRPEVTSTDQGTWRRLLLVPWNACFAGGGPTRDERVASHLREASGVFNRIALAWEQVRTNGLQIPKAVADASRTYRTDSDQVAQFAEERLKRCAGMDIPLPAVLTAYAAWCDENGEKPVASSGRKMAAEVKRLGFATKRGAKNVTFLENAMIPAG